MEYSIVSEILIALAFGIGGSIIFSAIGLISGTDETATMLPLTLLVVILGAPPAAILTFFLSGAISKHITHSVPTTMLGIPGDTMAIPMIEDANKLRKLGIPHVALQKMAASAIFAALIAVPVAVLIGSLLASYAGAIKHYAPVLFVIVAIIIAYFSSGKLASILLLIPFIVVVLGLKQFTAFYNKNLIVCYFLGIAVGPLLFELFKTLSPVTRNSLRLPHENHFTLVTDAGQKSSLNPLKKLDATQKKWIVPSVIFSSMTFVFSPVALTVIFGEFVHAKIKNTYHKLTTSLCVKEAVTEATYVAETLIPLIAIGLPLSPVSLGPASPLFVAGDRFVANPSTGEIHNLHTLLNQWEFLGFGLLSVLIAACIAYPFVIKCAPAAAKFVSKKIGHEVIVSAFIGLICLIGLWEGGIIGIVVILTLGLVGGALGKLGFNSGVQFMGYYTALSVPAILVMLGIN